MNKKVIVISAHPDDEILGVGGTLIRHRDVGDEIYWIIVTNVSEEAGFTKERVDSRQQEIQLVADRLGVKKTYKLDYPTATLTDKEMIDMVPRIAEIFKEVEPTTFYSLNRSDAHSDHRVVFNAGVACTKSFRHPYLREVLMYECISETEFAPMLPEKAFQPNCYIDISKQMDEKMELMKIYKSEIADHPFPRSERNIRAVGTFRGATAGVEYAEAFQLIKSIRIEEL